MHVDAPEGVPIDRRPRISPRRVALVCVAALVVAGTLVAMLPSFMWIEKPPQERPRILHQGVIYPTPAVVSEGEVYLPFDFIRDRIDANAFWDGQVLVITTRDKVIKFRTEELTAYVNQHPVELRFPVIMEGSMPYLPASVLEEVYAVSVTHYPEPRTVGVRRTDVSAYRGCLDKSVILRSGPSLLSRRVERLRVGEVVRIYGAVGRWLIVETSSGNAGYLRKESVRDIEPELPSEKEEGPQAPRSVLGPVFLVWEQVDSRTPDPSSIGEMPGVNVVSPTWFSLSREPGVVSNIADVRYVRWAHRRGYQVWALFSNGFDPERTSRVVRDSDLRDQVIAQVLLYAKTYLLDGINIDFENVYHADAGYLTQFVRELAAMARAQGLVVSMDVTVRSESPNWSLCYERRKLAEVLDYVILMAYDQYPWGSRVAGPVSTIPWTEECIRKTLEEVPAEKLILGVPFYTRLWTEDLSGGTPKVSSRALGMDAAEGWLAERGLRADRDTETGLRYAESMEGSTRYRLWLEDEGSMRMRMELMKKYRLAGVAAWRRGFERPAIYHVIEPFLEPDRRDEISPLRNSVGDPS